MSLKGDLGTVGLTTVLQLLESDSKTGLLQIKSKDKIAGLIVKEGSIAYATCSKSNSRLGYLLRTSGVITNEELELHLALSKETNQAFGKTLVDHNIITNETLSEFVQKQAENIIYDLFFWKVGEYEYKDTEINPERVLLEKINIMHVLLEASRRIDEMQVIKERIPEDTLVFEKSGNIKSVVDVLNEQEFSILALVDAKSSVSQVIEKSGFDEYSVYNILNSLIIAGCIQPYEERTPQEPVEEDPEQQKDPNSEELQMETNTLEAEETDPEKPDQPGDAKDEVPDDDERLEADQKSVEVVADGEKSIPVKPEDEKLDTSASKIIALFKGEKRFIAIGTSIVCLLIIVAGSIFVLKYIKTKRMETAYQSALTQAKNKSELEEQEKVLLDFLKSNKENIHSQDVTKKINNIRENIKERNYKLTISNVGKLSQSGNYVEARNVYKQYLAQYPKTGYAAEIQDKLSKINSLVEDEEYGKLKDITPKNYEARITGYDLYLKNHPKGKHRKKVESLTSIAIIDYGNFLKAETKAGKDITINRLIFENHKTQMLSISTDLMLPDEKLQVEKLLNKGKKELKSNNYEDAIKHLNQSLSVIRNSQLADFQAYKSYENEILSALDDENVKYFQKGLFQFKGKWYSLQEYEKTLQKHGYVKEKGAWYSPDEYETLMISRGFFKYEEKYLAQNSFENKVLVPVLKKKCKLEDWQKIDSIDVMLKGSNSKEIVYKIYGVAIANLEDYRVVIKMSVDATFNKKKDLWRFFNTQKDTSLVKYE